MYKEFLIASVVLLVLILFILFVINSLSLEVANKIKHDSEKLFNSYTKALDKMYVKKVEKQSSIVEEKTLEKMVYVLPSVLQEHSYKDTRAFDLHQSINDKFDLDVDNVLEKMDTSESNEYLTHQKMNDLLSKNNRLYNISTLDSESQVEIMHEFINENPEFKIYLDLLDNTFNIIDFKQYVEEKMVETSQKITVYTANRSDEKKSSESIHYVYDSRIIVGVQCLQADKLYDFAIEREEVC